METSPYAYEHALRTMRRNAASARTGESGAMVDTRPGETLGRVYGSLLWLYRLFIRLTVGEAATVSAPDYKYEAFVSRYSRATRRLIKRDRLFLDMGRLKIQLYIDHLMYAGLTPAQKQEKIARTSHRGRIAIYGLRYWGTRLQSRARLSCYDHGWWRMPSTSSVAGGLWDVQLPDN